MKNLGHLKSYSMKLTTITPIYIGGGEYYNLNKLQYYFDQSSKTLNIIDETKFSKFLLENKLLDNFIQFILNEKNPQLYNWLKENNLQNKSLNIFSKSQVIESVNSKDFKNDVNLFIRNFNNHAYIPGSTIKGAIRTALLVDIIIRNKQDYTNKYWENIKINLCNGKKKPLEQICNNIEKEAFSIGKFKSAQTDSIFRGLEISDTNGVSDTNLYFAQKEDLSPKKQKISRIPLWREYLKPYTDFYFEITIDDTIFPYTIEELNTALMNFAKFFNTQMNDNYNNLDCANIYLPDESDEKIIPNLCIGGGSGFITKTITYQIAPDFNSAKNAIAQYLDKTFTKKDKYSGTYFPAHNHVKEDKIISPRALKLAQDNDNKDYLSLGWCNISELNKE